MWECGISPSSDWSNYPIPIGHVLVLPEDEITDDNDPGEAHHNECKGQIVPSGDIDEDLARPEVET